MTTASADLNLAVTRTNLMDLDREGLRAFFADLGEKPFRAEQVMKWIYHHQVDDFADMTDLSLGLREHLAQVATVTAPEPISEQRSDDGTVKWLLALPGGNAVETVYIPEPNRGTLCVSSQVGCALNCSFCSTATQGFNRNLTTAEIVGQLWLAARRLGHERNGVRKITNVVMMGMGEPLLNFDALAPALRIMRHDFGFGLASKRVTVSTAGWVPGIDQLRDIVDVALAVSLHAPEDTLRSELVPLNKKYDIATLLAACRRYVEDKHKRSVTFEYTLMNGVNDQPEHARQLVKLLRDFPAKINLIPFNPFPGTRFRCSDPVAIDRFQAICKAGGLVTTVRRTRGEDIDAACGQLVGKVLDRTRRQARHQARLAGTAAS